MRDKLRKYKLLGAVSAGADEEILLDKPSTSTSSDPAAAEGSTIPRNKIKISNTLPETAELQRLVLLEQLKLCRMQQQQCCNGKRQGVFEFIVRKHHMPNSIIIGR
ncbi:hypothetical protein JTB14_024975 [Gonioctena quinquepunctata]|nr:hypothetical protein JTB14_024975 [Gonioctena quinquepunctata]